MNRIVRAFYRRLGILHVGRRRVRDLIDYLEDRRIDLVIDVGANVGQFGESLRKGGYRGRIVSFEPIASAFQTLSQKAAADGNWQVHHCGLGPEAGKAVLNISELSVCSSLLDVSSVAGLHDRRTAYVRTEEIEVRTLDQVAADLPGQMFLKIDTQGYERQVMEGGRRTLARALGVLLELPVIHMYEGEWQFHEALQFMRERGFVPAQMLPVNYHGQDRVSAVEFDCLFRPLSEVDGVQGPQRRG